MTDRSVAGADGSALGLTSALGAVVGVPAGLEGVTSALGVRVALGEDVCGVGVGLSDPLTPSLGLRLGLGLTPAEKGAVEVVGAPGAEVRARTCRVPPESACRDVETVVLPALPLSEVPVSSSTAVTPAAVTANTAAAPTRTILTCGRGRGRGG